MPVKSEWITYGDQIGYFAILERAARPLPSVVVIQEIGGVNDNIEDITRRIAAAGYAALAPDIYAVNGERPTALSNERFEESFAFMMTLPPAARFDPTHILKRNARKRKARRSGASGSAWAAGFLLCWLARNRNSTGPRSSTACRRRRHGSHA